MSKQKNKSRTFCKLLGGINKIFLVSVLIEKQKVRDKNSKNGFAALYLTVLILAVIIAISVSISILTFSQQKISRNITKSSQAYYAAEAGIEDALLRLIKNLNWSSPYTLSVDNGTSTIEISDIVGGSRTITSEGNVAERRRKIQVAYEISSEKTSFYYGAQVGEGGIEMQDTAKIQGNVFSNGSVINLSGNPQITDTVKIAKTGNKLTAMKVGGDAYVDTCENSEITGNLICATSTNCTASEILPLSGEIATSSLPISEEQISEWKTEAASGGIIAGNYLLAGQQQDFLGPKKIEGNMTIQDNAKLFVTGTIWVTGTITIQNGAEVRLDQSSYGSLSGVVIADGKITIQDNAVVSGTGQAGSYLMLLSTLDSIVTGDVAIVVQNTPEVDIVYASKGRIQLQDSIELREICGWGLKLQNNATVIYESGLADVSFTTGPAGSWEVTDWKEIE